MRHEITLVFPYKNFSRILLPVVIEKSIVVYLQLLSVVEISKNYLLYGGHHGAIVVGECVYLVVSKRERQTVKEESNYVAFPHFQVGQWRLLMWPFKIYFVMVSLTTSFPSWVRNSM